MHKIWLLLLPGFLLVDLLGVCAAFKAAGKRRRGRAGYAVRLASFDGAAVLSSSGVPVSTGKLPGRLTGHAAALLVSAGHATHNDAYQLQCLHRWLNDNRRQLDRCGWLSADALPPLMQNLRLAGRTGRRTTSAPTPKDARRYTLGRKPNVHSWRIVPPGQGENFALGLIEEDLGTDFAHAPDSKLSGRRHGGLRIRIQQVAQRTFDARIDRLNRWIALNLHEKLNVARLAQELHMSTRSFVRLYERTTGLSPGRGVHQIRLDAARRLIEAGDLPLKSIAGQCGYGSQEVMRRAFVRDLRMTPSEYRQHFRMIKDIDSSRGRLPALGTGRQS